MSGMPPKYEKGKIVLPCGGQRENLRNWAVKNAYPDLEQKVQDLKGYMHYENPDTTGLANDFSKLSKPKLPEFVLSELESQALRAKNTCGGANWAQQLDMLLPHGLASITRDPAAFTVWAARCDHAGISGKFFDVAATLLEERFPDPKRLLMDAPLFINGIKSHGLLFDSESALLKLGTSFKSKKVEFQAAIIIGLVDFDPASSLKVPELLNAWGLTAEELKATKVYAACINDSICKEDTLDFLESSIQEEKLASI